MININYKDIIFVIMYTILFVAIMATSFMILPYCFNKQFDNSFIAVDFIDKEDINQFK